MTIDSSNAPEGDAEVADDDDGEDVESLKATIDRLKREAKQAYEKRDKKSKAVEERDAKLAEYERREREAAEAQARKDKDFAKLEKMLSEEKAALASELEQMRAQIAEAEKGKRASAFLDAVMMAGGFQADSKAIVEGLLLREERSGEDIAPSEQVEARAKALAKKLRAGAPLLAKPISLGPNGTPGAPQDAGEVDDAALKRAIDSLNRGRGQ